MNLNQLSKAELVEVISKMTGELNQYLADSSMNSIQRFTNLDNGLQSYLITLGQFKVNVDGLMSFVEGNPTEAKIVSDKTSIAALASIRTIEVYTENASVVDLLKGSVNYSYFELEEKDLIVEDNEAPAKGYTLSFEFREEKK